MLDDYKPLRRNQMRFIEELEHQELLLLVLVRRIEKDEIGHPVARRKFLESFLGGNGQHLGGAVHPERREILLNQSRARRVPFDENHFFRAAADRLDPDRAGARIEVDEKRILHGRAENIEQRLAQTVARRPHPQLPRPLQLPPPEFSRDHPHRLIPPTPADTARAKSGLPLRAASQSPRLAADPPPRQTPLAAPSPESHGRATAAQTRTPHPHFAACRKILPARAASDRARRSRSRSTSPPSSRSAHAHLQGSFWEPRGCNSIFLFRARSFRATGATARGRTDPRARSPSRWHSARPRRPRSQSSPQESAARPGGTAPSPNPSRHFSAARAAGRRAASERHLSPAARIPTSPPSAPASTPRSPDTIHTLAGPSRFHAARIPTRPAIARRRSSACRSACGPAAFRRSPKDRGRRRASARACAGSALQSSPGRAATRLFRSAAYAAARRSDAARRQSPAPACETSPGLRSARACRPPASSRRFRCAPTPLRARRASARSPPNRRRSPLVRTHAAPKENAAPR